MPSDLRALRRAIDAVDRAVVRLLARRFALAARLAPLKRRVRAPGREREVLAKVARCARRCGLDPAAARSVYRRVMAQSRRCQRRCRVAKPRPACPVEKIE